MVERGILAMVLGILSPAFMLYFVIANFGGISVANMVLVIVGVYISGIATGLGIVAFNIWLRSRP